MKKTLQRLASSAVIRWLAVGGGIILALAALVAWRGLTHMFYFSPDTFMCKSQIYYSIPLLNIQVTPTREREYSLPLFEYLRDQGFVGRPRVTVTRWHFVRGYTVGLRGAGAARRIVDLNGRDLIKWSEENPERARALWPPVVSLTRQGRYTLASTLVDLAVKEESDDEFRYLVETWAEDYGAAPAPPD